MTLVEYVQVAVGGRGGVAGVASPFLAGSLGIEGGSAEGASDDGREDGCENGREDGLDSEEGHLRSLYASMLKQQESLGKEHDALGRQREWLGSEILRMEELLGKRKRVGVRIGVEVGMGRTKSVSMCELGAVHVRGASVDRVVFEKKLEQHKSVGGGSGVGVGVQTQRERRVFRDDTAIYGPGEKPLLARVTSEPEAQSVVPRSMSVSEQAVAPGSLPLRKVESRKRLVEREKKSGDDDQMSLCAREEDEREEREERYNDRTKSEQASPRTAPVSPMSPMRRHVGEVMTDDSVDMQRRYNRKMQNQSAMIQLSSGRSSYEREAVDVPRPSHDRSRDREYMRDNDGARSRGYRLDDREYRDARDDGRRRDRSRSREREYPRMRRSGSESCPDFLRVHSHGGLMQPCSPVSDGYPVVHGGGHDHGHRAFSHQPSLNMMPSNGGYMMPMNYFNGMQMQMNSPFFNGMQMQPGMQPMNPQMVMSPQMNYFGAQHPQQFNRPLVGHSYSIGSGMNSMAPVGLGPTARTAHTPAKDILSEAARLQNRKNKQAARAMPAVAPANVPANVPAVAPAPAGRPQADNKSNNHQNPIYDDTSTRLPGLQTTTTTTKTSKDTNSSLQARTPHVAAPSIITSIAGDDQLAQPISDIQDFNLTPEEIESLFEGFDDLVA